MITRFAAAGLIIPIIFGIIFQLLSWSTHLNRALGEFLNYVQLIFFPSSILMLAGTGSSRLAIDLWLIATGLNILLYALIGLVVAVAIKLFK